MSLYLGATKYNVYLGATRIKGYLGATKVFGGDPVAQSMDSAWTTHLTSGTLQQQANGPATVLNNIDGTGWGDYGHQLVIVLTSPCLPTAISFLTPTIVNSGQATNVTYTIYGSNSAWNTVPNNMAWDTLRSGTWTQSHAGGTNISIPITATKDYKYIRMESTWFYGANDYHGFALDNLVLTGES